MKTLITLVLTSHLIPDSNPLSALGWRAIKQIVESGDPDAVLAFAQHNLSPADAERIAERMKRIAEIESAVEALEQRQISVLTEFDPQYPQRWNEKIGERRPSHLYFAGNADLLNIQMIGVVGSRDVDRAGAEFAEAIAQAAVAAEFGIVSGGARGVDRLSMNAAYQAGGETVGILADSLEEATREAERAGAFDYGRTCLCSPYLPTSGFQVGHAMSRNKLIYGLSEATVVVSSAEGTGGTWAGAIEALESHLCPVLVRDGAEVPPGNARLIERGATAIRDVTELEPLVRDAQTLQGSLF